MTTYKTYLFSALALGTIGMSFATTEALADHRDGRGKGYGPKVVDLYVDADHDRQLERAIGEYLQAYNPYINIVYSKRNADVTVKVDGYMSEPEIYDRGRRARGGYASMAYDYKIKIRAGGRTIYRDRVYGEVNQPLNKRGRYHNGSTGSKIEKAERALEVFGVILGTIKGNTYDSRYQGGYGKIVPKLRYEAIDRIAQSFGHIKIPRRYGRGRR